MSVTEGEHEETRTKNGLEKAGDDELGEPQFWNCERFLRRFKGLVSVLGRRTGLEEGWGAPENDEAVGEADSSEGIQEAENGSMKEIGGDGGGSDERGYLFTVKLYEDDEKVITGGDGVLPDNIVGAKLHDGCLES